MHQIEESGDTPRSSMGIQKAQNSRNRWRGGENPENEISS